MTHQRVVDWITPEMTPKELEELEELEGKTAGLEIFDEIIMPVIIPIEISILQEYGEIGMLVDPLRIKINPLIQQGIDAMVKVSVNKVALSINC